MRSRIFFAGCILTALGVIGLGLAQTWVIGYTSSQQPIYPAADYTYLSLITIVVGLIFTIYGAATLVPGKRWSWEMHDPKQFLTPPGKSAIQDKLDRLDHLYGRGGISKEEYEEQRKKILEDL